MRAGIAVLAAAAAESRLWVAPAPQLTYPAEAAAMTGGPAMSGYAPAVPQYVVAAPRPAASSFAPVAAFAAGVAVVAFAVGGRAQAPARRTAGVQMAIAKPSKALPFLEAPACQSSGLPGAETGFDPLYFSDFIDIKWLREAELKHGRICMLASTGYMFQEFFSLPDYPGYTPNAVEAATSVPPVAMAQIIAFMAYLEIITNKGKFSMSTMFEDPAREPGNLGFDPLKFGENPATRQKLEMAELKNGRLAMIAFSGMIHQTFVTGKPLFASLGDIWN